MSMTQRRRAIQARLRRLFKCRSWTKWDGESCIVFPVYETSHIEIEPAYYNTRPMKLDDIPADAVWIIKHQLEIKMEAHYHGYPTTAVIYLYRWKENRGTHQTTRRECIWAEIPAAAFKAVAELADEVEKEIKTHEETKSQTA